MKIIDFFTLLVFLLARDDDKDIVNTGQSTDIVVIKSIKKLNYKKDLKYP